MKTKIERKYISFILLKVNIVNNESEESKQ